MLFPRCLSSLDLKAGSDVASKAELGRLFQSFTARKDRFICWTLLLALSLKIFHRGPRVFPSLKVKHLFTSMFTLPLKILKSVIIWPRLLFGIMMADAGFVAVLGMNGCWFQELLLWPASVPVQQPVGLVCSVGPRWHFRILGEVVQWFHKARAVLLHPGVQRISLSLPASM